MKPPREHFAAQRGRLAAQEPGAGPQLLPWMYERFPSLLIETTKQETLDGTPARLATSEQSSGKHTGVVHNEQVPAAQPDGQITNRRVGERAGAAIEHEQTGCSTFSRRRLRDKPGRKVEIEIGNVQDGSQFTAIGNRELTAEF